MNPDTFSIALLHPDQIPAAAELFGAQLAEHRITTSLERVLAVLGQMVADERLGFVLVASAPDGKLLGVAYGCAILSVEHGGQSGWLDEFYVRPEYRGLGIGARLLAQFIRVATTRGWRAIDLEVEADHQRVVSLYERHGFRPHSRSRFFRKLP
ncbi:MAG TPA: GNAT family N-acetyltransferase [Candidatus Limnocylindria bacterium]|jgi:GNAT superfamily N-acetyltransferase|nr:GNAT family N-acetyltransferase [Candidatus Limnocylindria bacterium]